MDMPPTILAIINSPSCCAIVQQALDASDLLARYTLAHYPDLQSQLASGHYDCILLDVGMPTALVQAALNAVRTALPMTAVVALLPAQLEPFASDTLIAEQYLPLALLTPAMLVSSVRNAIHARQYEALQMARATDAEAAHDTLRLLMDVSRALADNDNCHESLAHVATCIVQHFADWCAIDLVEDGQPVRVGTAVRAPDALAFSSHHADPQAVIFRLTTLFNKGSGQFYPDLSTVRSDKRVGARLAMLARAGAASLISVPLRARGQTLGRITLVRNTTSKRFAGVDYDVAEEIARRVALVADNALLYRTAQESIRARDIFLSVAAHELKTPLTALLGYATLLKRRLERGIQQPDRDLRGVNIMVEQGHRLSKLLNTLLEISRMPDACQDVQQSQCNLSGLTRHVVAEMRPLLRYHTLEVKMPAEDVVVTGDTERLEMVIHNLLQNAVQYSPAGGAITVSLALRDGEACLSVQDHGVGIPREALPRIFGRFYRSNDTSVHTATGMGVGLYIVKQIIEIHGGYVDVQSVEGVGSTFTVCLPLYEPYEHASEVAA